MDRGLPDDRTVTTAIDLATRAPSVHNTQPWRWRIGDRSVHLYADLERQVSATDPDQRDLVMSCGAALHHVRVAFAALGWSTTVDRLPNPDEPDHLASLKLTDHTPSPQDLELSVAISRRRTDRRRYSTWEVPPAYLRQLVDRAAETGVVVRQVPDGGPRTKLIAALDEAARRHAADPEYRREISIWSGRHGSLDGVPAHSTVVPDDGDEIPARAFAAGQLAQPPGAGPEDAATLLALGTSSDDRMSWLRAGEAMSAMSLTATSLGLATCPITEPLEMRDLRTLVRRDVLGDSGFPQLVLRVGWALPRAETLPATPRRPVEEVIGRLDPTAAG